MSHDDIIANALMNQRKSPLAQAATACVAEIRAENARLREALGKARDALIDPVNIKSIVCTVWMPSPCPETLVDFIDAALGDTP